MNILHKEKPVKFRKFGKLPGKPSQLIRIAMTDLAKAEKAKLKIDMGDWVTLQYKKPKNKPAVKVCTVCLAGSVMMNTLGDTKRMKEMKCANGQPFEATDSKKYEFIPSHDFDWRKKLTGICTDEFEKEERALEALNSLREGRLEEAFEYLYLQLPFNMLDNVKVTGYHVNKDKFRKDMRELANALARAGY